MNYQEYEVLSEIARVVENYNAIIADAPSFDGRGAITLVGLPELPDALIDRILVTMQRQKLALEERGCTEHAAEVDHCVLQVHDLKGESVASSIDY